MSKTKPRPIDPVLCPKCQGHPHCTCYPPRY
jgi:hypothetical protein